MVNLAKAEPAGKCEPNDGGTLFLPAKMKLKSHVPLVVFFHGRTWLPEVAASKIKTAVITMQLGSGSGALEYLKPLHRFRSRVA